jgi:hypothetical protein
VGRQGGRVNRNLQGGIKENASADSDELKRNCLCRKCICDRVAGKKVCLKEQMQAHCAIPHATAYCR